MRGMPFYLDVMNAAERGAAMRAAERRAMYARPDAEPLPEEAETSRTRRWAPVPGALRQGVLVVSRLVGRARIADSDPA